MICACGNQAAYNWQSGFCKNEAGEKVRWESCDRCGDVSTPYVPDVYFKPGEVYESLGGISFASRREKAEYLKSKGYAEMGDRVHGGDPLDAPTRVLKPVNREEIRRAIAEAKRELKERGRI